MMLVTLARLAGDPAQEDDGQERAEHEDVAVGEVDQLDDPVDHRVAERDERVDRADRQRVDRLLERLPQERHGRVVGAGERRSQRPETLLPAASSELKMSARHRTTA